MRINVADRMRSLIDKLRYGFNGIIVPLEPEIEDQWDANYAIVKGYFYDVPELDSIYESFSHDEFQNDFEEMLKSHFGIDKVMRESGGEKPQTGDLVVRCYPKSQEIEAYYQT